VDAVAICLLFAFLHPEHEQKVGEAVKEALPDLHVSLSSEVLPEFREYERFSTTVADAYLGPKLAAYLERLAGGADEAGVPAPARHAVLGRGGRRRGGGDGGRRLRALRARGRRGRRAHVREASGYEDVLTFDMGGTSTDVAPVLGGEASTTTESVVAGVPIKLPMVDVHTVSAGGGSIAWADPGGALRVGPRSAGADPGPGRLRQGRRGADGDRRQPAARLPRRRRGAGRRADAVGGRRPRPL
jgi:N-methylhydantoinase A